MTNQNIHGKQKIVIVGGGLAGLTAATIIARAGISVLIIEKSTEAGGRARTSSSDGFYLNQGPHAIYAEGPGSKILNELGIRYTGKKVTTERFYVLKKGKRYPLPVSLRQFLTTKLLKGWGSRIEAIRFFASLAKINPEYIQDIPLEEWINKNVWNSDVKELVKMFSRVATYCNDTKTQSAGAAITQLQISVASGVIYLDDGWQTLVNGLTAAAIDAGVNILTGNSAMKIENFEKNLPYPWLIHLSNGNTISAQILIIAAGPMDAYQLLKHSDMVDSSAQIAKAAIPVRVATLDIALAALPNPNLLGAFGLDNPIYLSTHSAFARLAPNDGAVLHAIKYLGSSVQPNPRADREELEKLMDSIQPGWKKVAIKTRFLPNMIVSNAMVPASNGGIYGRPDVTIPGTKNLYLVGDWVGPEGLLADASLSSAKRAAETIIRIGNGNKSQKLASVTPISVKLKL